MTILRALLAALLLPTCALAAEQNDLREFHIGMKVSELPEKGYTGFACAADPAKKIAGWRDYKSCPADPDGTHAVSFRYASSGLMSDDDDKTQVGGQPVMLALLIDNGDKLAGIRIETDPHARLYMHKKAFLFALQVRQRFGEEGWTCQSIPQTPTEQPVGGVFIHEHCEKTTPTRHYILDRQLFRDPAKDLRELTDATQLTISPGKAVAD